MRYRLLIGVLGIGFAVAAGIVLSRSGNVENVPKPLVATSAAASQPPALSTSLTPAPIDAKLVGVMIDSSDHRRSVASLEVDGTTGLYRVGDAVKDAELAEIHRDYVILTRGPERITVAAISQRSQEAKLSDPEVDHKANLEIAKKTPGFIFDERAVRDIQNAARESNGNEAFKAAIERVIKQSPAN